MTSIDPVDILLAEHRGIMAELAALRRTVRNLELGGNEAVPEALPALRAAGALMADALLLHARKEDEALFPALEEALDAPVGPTAVLREEHRTIHREAELFRRTLHELHEVEHPEMEARGERLRALADGGGEAAALRDVAAGVLGLLDAHFGKEEAVLFPMARELLSPGARRRVLARMEEIEAEAAR